MQAELRRRFDIENPDPGWPVVGEISAEQPGQSDGGASPGRVILSGQTEDQRTAMREDPYGSFLS